MLDTSKRKSSKRVITFKIIDVIYGRLRVENKLELLETFFYDLNDYVNTVPASLQASRD